MGVQFHPVLFELYAGLRDRYQTDDGLIIPHAHQAGYWHASDGEMETLVEIHSLHGYFEWFGRMYLEQGFNTGFITASEDHPGHPGYTSVRPRGFIYQGGLATVRAGQKTLSKWIHGMLALVPAVFYIIGAQLLFKFSFD